MFTDTELFCAILAASIHDVGHPGYNNQFLINSCPLLSSVFGNFFSRSVCLVKLLAYGGPTRGGFKEKGLVSH